MFAGAYVCSCLCLISAPILTSKQLTDPFSFRSFRQPRWGEFIAGLVTDTSHEAQHGGPTRGPTTGIHHGGLRGAAEGHRGESAASAGSRNYFCCKM